MACDSKESPTSPTPTPPQCEPAEAVLCQEVSNDCKAVGDTLKPAVVCNEPEATPSDSAATDSLLAPSDTTANE